MLIGVFLAVALFKVHVIYYSYNHAPVKSLAKAWTNVTHNIFKVLQLVSILLLPMAYVIAVLFSNLYLHFPEHHHSSSLLGVVYWYWYVYINGIKFL
jgi:hypothetical protein